MRRLRPVALSVALLWLLAACGSSPPAQYYTLDTSPPTAAPPAGRPVALRISRVDLPSSLDRSNFVRRSGANRLDVSDIDRWGGSLDDMIGRVLSADLMQRLPAGSIVGADAPDGRSLILGIQTFEADNSGKIVLQVVWTLTGGSAPPLSRARDIEVTAGATDTRALVAAMSKALGNLADPIAQALVRG